MGVEVDEGKGRLGISCWSLRLVRCLSLVRDVARESCLIVGMYVILSERETDSQVLRPLLIN